MYCNLGVQSVKVLVVLLRQTLELHHQLCQRLLLPAPKVPHMSHLLDTSTNNLLTLLLMLNLRELPRQHHRHQLLILRLTLLSTILKLFPHPTHKLPPLKTHAIELIVIKVPHHPLLNLLSHLLNIHSLGLVLSLALCLIVLL